MTNSQTAGQTAQLSIIPNTRQDLPERSAMPYHDISYYEVQYSGKSGYTENEIWAATIALRQSGDLHPYDRIVSAENGIAKIEHSYPIGD